MKKTINLQEKSKHISSLFGLGVIAILVFSIFSIQSVNAAITSQLDFGDRGSEVTELQTYLSANANIYPSGLVTGYFGPLTKAGVERFQTAQGIVSSGTPTTTGYGRVGPITKASINAQLSGGGNFSEDIFAPTIKNVYIDTDDNSVSISWRASEASMGKVYYSTSPIRIDDTFDSTGRFSGEPEVSGILAQYDRVSRITHTVEIDNLDSDTRYYYLIVVFDSSKNASFTTPNSFWTE